MTASMYNGVPHFQSGRRAGSRNGTPRPGCAQLYGHVSNCFRLFGRATALHDCSSSHGLRLLVFSAQSGQQVRPADADGLPRHHREPEQPHQLAGELRGSLRHLGCVVGGGTLLPPTGPFSLSMFQFA